MTGNTRPLNTERSDALVAAFENRTFKAARRVIEFTRTVPAAPEAVYRQLCPTREADWIDGWTSELIYTDSGYGEDLCVFRTDADNVVGPGLWTFTHREPPRLLKIVRFMPPFVQHLSIALTDNGDGTTEILWTVVITALDERGNALMKTLPQDDEVFAGSADALVSFFETGERRPRPDTGAGHGKGSFHGFLAAVARHAGH